MSTVLKNRGDESDQEKFNGKFSACEMELTYLLQNPRKNVLVT